MPVASSRISVYGAPGTRWGLDGGYVPPPPAPTAASPERAEATSRPSAEAASSQEDTSFETIVFRVFD